MSILWYLIEKNLKYFNLSIILPYIALVAEHFIRVLNNYFIVYS